MENRKAILITGTSTGIGRACALHLDKLGYKVYAGVRREEDADSLRSEASENLTALILDVTDESSIETALSRIEQENDGKLSGLVNNAGIGISGVVEVTPIEEVRKVLDVNVIGLYALTKAAIPMIRKGKGRIINIGSSSSFFAFPGSSVYSASKFAVRAITDSLRVEMKLFGVPVVLIAPGAVESAIWEKSLEYKKKLRETVKPELAQLYEPFRIFGDKLIEKVRPIPAAEVADTVAHVLECKKPKIYYTVGKDAKGVKKAARLPGRLLDWMIMKHVNQAAK